MSSPEKDVLPWTDHQLLHQAAYLYVEEELSPANIATQLNRDKSAVSRWLNEARQKKIIVETQTLDVSTSVREQIRVSIYGTETLQTLKRFAEENRVFNSGRTITHLHTVAGGKEAKNSNEYDDRLPAFGSSVASVTAQLLAAPFPRKESGKRQESYIGIGRGRQLRVAIDAVRRRSGLPAPSKVDRVFALWGEAWGALTDRAKSQIFADRYSLSSNSLSLDLAEYCNPDDPNAYFPIEGVPTALPDGFRDSVKQNEILDQYFRKMGLDSWDIVFGRENFSDDKPAKANAFVTKAHTILAGIGSKEFPGRFLDPKYLSFILGEQHSKRLLKLICGDVCGVFIPVNANRMSKSDCDFFDDMRRLWTGVRAVDLEQCVTQSAINGTNGVVAYASYREGAAKVALEAIRHGLISQLICDDLVATELQRLAAAELPTTSKRGTH